MIQSRVSKSSFVTIASLEMARVHTVLELGPSSHAVVCMCDAYVDVLAHEGAVSTGTAVFTLNTMELALETFRLQQDQLLAKITEDRLSERYVEELVYGPMRAAIEFAQEDVNGAKRYCEQIELRLFKLGSLAFLSPSVEEYIGLLQERTALLERARADLIQRQIEINGQRRRLKAEKDDIEARLKLNQQINEIHTYVMPFDGFVEFKTFNGAFVKKRDELCIVSSKR
jgi:hypothetical protein